MKEKYKYDIGISYASEQKEYVKTLESSLIKQGITCFIDYKEPERLWGEYIPEELRKIYFKECRMILVIISKEYTEKNYTKFESRIACERELSGESLLIIKMGDFTLPWLNSTYGYLESSKYTTDEIAGFIKKKANKDLEITTVANLVKEISGMIKKFFSKEKNAFSVSTIKEENETAITLNFDNKKIFFKLWIDRRFDENGELCVFLGGTTPVIPRFFNGVIRCEDKQFVVNNFGFFRRKAELTIRYYDKENLYNDILNEILFWSEHFND